MPTAYAGGIYPFCLSFFFFCLFFFLFTKGIEFDRHELALQNLYFRDYYFIQVSLCQSILWHVYLAYFAYICTSVRQQEILLLFCNYTANSRGIKKRFSYHFNESLYYLRSHSSHCFKSSIFTSRATDSFSFIYIKIHVIIFFAST